MRATNHFLKWALAATLFAAAGPASRAATQEAPDVLYRNGITSFSSGAYADAAGAFREIIERFGKEPSLADEMEGVYYALGCSYYNLGSCEDAVKAFEAYIKQYPKAAFVDEGLFRIGAAHQAGGSFDQAVTAYERLLREMPRSPYAEDAAFQIGICHLVQMKHKNAAEAFEHFLAAYPDSDLAPQAAMFRARALFETGHLRDAVAILQGLEGRGGRFDHIVYVNFLAVEIGDAAFDETDYDLALSAYRRVRTKQYLLRLQRAYVQQLQQELAALEKQPMDARAVSARFRQERRLRTSFQQAADLLEKLEAIPDYDAGLFHRIGRCFMNSDRFWEAAVAFTRVVEEAGDENIREAAHFDLILVLSRMRRFEDLIAEADRYLAQYE